MSWTTVNAPKIFEDSFLSSANMTGGIEQEAGLSVASKFRVNILSVADSITKNSSKRRKSSKGVTKTTTQKSQASIVKVRRATNNQRNNRGEGDTIAFTKQTSKIETQLSSDPGKHNLGADTSVKSTESSGTANKPTPPSTSFPGTTHVVAEILDTPTSLTSTFIEISSDDESMVFEVIDFSESDFDKEPDTRVASSSIAPSRDVAKNLTQSASSPEKQNAPPIPPFMHPGLEHEIDAFSQATQRFTCFRAGELLKLVKGFEAFQVLRNSSLTVEFFANVREVCFADNTGQGQGIVFADIFFPEKPPFIAASSKMPYSVYEPKARASKPELKQGLIKATLAYRSRLPNASTRHLLSSNYVSNMSDTRNTILEILEIRHSSWEEVREVKEMIETEIRATSAVLPVTRAHRRSVDAASVYNLEINETVLAQLTDEVEFSDIER